MYSRILVPLDGTASAEGILPFAERIAGPVDAEVVLLQVVEPLSAAEIVASAGVTGVDTLHLRELEGKRYLATIADRLGDKGLRTRSILRLGSAAPEILAAISDEKIDLVAMATHARTGLGRLVLGSVARRSSGQPGSPCS
jgi:nucleotide-binding universal stress UspA family protein